MSDIGQSAGKITSWLGGIIDGEGSIMMTSQKMKSGFIKYFPIVSITNTDDLIINKCLEEIKKVTGCFVQERKTKNFIAKDIKIKGHKRCKEFLPEIIPHLYGRKKEKAIKLLEWINYRETLEHNKPADHLDKQFYDYI